jgi:hypothetical protein
MWWGNWLAAGNFEEFHPAVYIRMLRCCRAAYFYSLSKVPTRRRSYGNLRGGSLSYFLSDQSGGHNFQGVVSKSSFYLFIYLTICQSDSGSRAVSQTDTRFVVYYLENGVR